MAQKNTVILFAEYSIGSEHQSWSRTVTTTGTATLDGSFLRTCSQAASVHVNLLFTHSLIHYCIFFASFRHVYHDFVYFLLSISLAEILALWGQGTGLLLNPLANTWHKKYLSNKLTPDKRETSINIRIKTEGTFIITGSRRLFLIRGKVVIWSLWKSSTAWPKNRGNMKIQNNSFLKMIYYRDEKTIFIKTSLELSKSFELWFLRNMKQKAES